MSDQKVLQPYGLTMARHKLGTNELRIVSSILLEIKKYQQKVLNTDMSVDDACDALEYIEIKMADVSVHNNHDYIRTALQALRKHDVSIPVKEGEEDFEHLTGIILTARCSKNSPVIKLQLDKMVIPHLVALSQNYSKYSIEFIFKAKSSYAIRWYQIASHWLNKGVFNITKEDIRETFGIDDDKYNRHSDFEKKIIKNPFSEINKKSDITIEIAEKFKDGRNIVSYRFIVKRKKQKEALKDVTPNQKTQIQEQNNLTSLDSSFKKGLSDAQIRKLAVYKKDFIESNTHLLLKNDNRGYDEIFEEWKPKLQNQESVNNFKGLRRLLSKKATSAKIKRNKEDVIHQYQGLSQQDAEKFANLIMGEHHFSKMTLSNDKKLQLIIERLQQPKYVSEYKNYLIKYGCKLRNI